MSLTYTTLQTAVIAMAKRSDLTARIPDFIRLAEGMIRRKVRAHETRVTLLEASRTSGGLYTLPDTVQEVRAAYAENGDDSYALENVGVAGIRMLPVDADVLHYAVVGSTIEFRGVPGTDAEIELVGIGWPDPLATTATNDLLTYHEGLYIYGTLVHLYHATQDVELAQMSLSSFTATVHEVNELLGRKRGGGSILPAYNFGHARTGRGY